MIARAHTHTHTLTHILYECVGLTETRNKWRANFARIALKCTVEWPTPLLFNEPQQSKTIENALKIPSKATWDKQKQNPNFPQATLQAIYQLERNIEHDTNLHYKKFLHKVNQIKKEKQKQRSTISAEQRLINRLEKQKLKKIIDQKIQQN